MITIRASVLQDIPELQELEIDAGQLFYEVGLGEIAEDDPLEAAVLTRHIHEGTAWTAERQTEAVGYAVASVVDGAGHLDQLSVRRSAGRQGIGRLLIDEVCRWAVSRGFEALTLTTFTEVPWNGPYYERLGFRRLTNVADGSELRAILDRERAAGLDVAPRAAMRLDLDHWTPPTQDNTT